jgi:hypothetical protein
VPTDTRNSVRPPARVNPLEKTASRPRIECKTWAEERLSKEIDVCQKISRLTVASLTACEPLRAAQRVHHCRVRRERQPARTLCRASRCRQECPAPTNRLPRRDCASAQGPQFSFTIRRSDTLNTNPNEPRSLGDSLIPDSGIYRVELLAATTREGVAASARCAPRVRLCTSLVHLWESPRAATARVSEGPAVVASMRNGRQDPTVASFMECKLHGARCPG